MAVRYDAVDQADDGSSHADSPGHSPFPPDSASPLSPITLPVSSHATSTAAMASLASPPASSPLPDVALAEQTFTPLSMGTSDFFPSDNMGGKTTPAAVEADRLLLSTSRSMEQLRRNGNLSRSSSSKSTAAAAPASAGPTIVSAMVESFEALQAATSTATLGYELLRTKSAGQRPAGLVSPPSTLSPSPSPAPLAPGNALVLDAALTADGGLGAAALADKTTPVAAQDENTTVPLTAAATPNPDPSAPISNAAPAHDAPASPPSAVVASTTLIRPTPSASQPQQRRSRAVSTPIRPPIIRTSSNASLSLSHPAPDPNKLSQAGNFLGNIAALEATAERLSMTSSIEDAIREEHNELKRSESRRSSILRARAASTSDNGSVYGQSQLSVASRQNSILGINNAARSGGYSPGGFIMSPHHSMSAASGRLRSGSKASSIGMPAHIPENTDMAGALADLEHAQEFRFLPRHGPGKASTRSVASKMSLAQIAELEHPTALTQEALDEADRAAAAGETPVVEDNIRNSAHQFIEAEFEFANGADDAMLGYGSHAEPTPRLQLHQPDQYQPYRPHNGGGDDRPTTSGSGATYDQAQAAFGDFDGVHCDPDAGDLALLPEPERREPPLRSRATLAPRPATYFDPATGQHMMFYPAPVPAMLNLPPKLSKKPKAPARASALPKASHESRIWLPDPTEGLRRSNDDAPFMGSLLGESSASTDAASQPSGMELERLNYLAHARHPSEASTIHPPLEQRDLRRPQRLTDADDRTSRPIAVDGMPPQLRASAFFDLPAETPKIEVKDGSAMNTLDSLLDASAAAPVSAFTDHVFAGKLGAEIYGPEKKKKKVKKSSTAPALAPTPAPEEKAKRKTLVKRNSSSNLLEPGAEDKPKRNKLVKRNSSGNLLDPNEEKKRASRFSLFGPKRADDESDDDAGDRPRSARRSLDDDAQSRGSASPNQLAPDADEETETESEEEGPVYQGPPTTLLAELQLRKQQNKLRTRPAHHVYTEGMRSTLLELDAVAEVERKARHGKRITLAWEDPAAVPRPEEEEDDEVPLGMLFAAKAATPGANRSTMDISALMSEVHRPLGLMERREIEENEPLSRRRDRLQGRVGELPSSLTVLQNRMSHMPPTPGMGMGMRLGLPQAAGSRAGSRAGSMLGSRPGSAAGKPGDGSEPEVEGETLAARKARLAAENPLPRARPVSSAFSAELLREFGPDEEEAQKNKAAAANLAAHSRTASRDVDANADADANGGGPVPEEEETLGQRRRRLQREREAREREMAFSSLTRAATPLGMNPTPPGVVNTNTIRAVRPPQMGMADVLGAHPTAGQPVLMTMDPRERERVRREAEAARYQRDAEVKMAALRAQMPTSLTAPAVGGRSGGYLGGRFNDGGGGTGVQSGLGGYAGQGGLLGGNHGMMGQQHQQQRASTLLGAQGMGVGGVGMGVGMGMGMGGYGGSTPNLGVYPNGVAASMSAAGYPMPMPMPMPMGDGGQGHMDMVERWRQGVMP
ncbi:hypothetical protein C8A01DRAFT_20836 [Parachaetomium inaequale]|uniref:Uncharacterized protein n=1 Tax=Parachaetomium inaequale TaxID=2588326 RepID=A0AAN6P5B4_9PEZI|nr:hypothetical protein C8A01DRAFT_20836 [Parachaetomium inaequale]